MFSQIQDKKILEKRRSIEENEERVNAEKQKAQVLREDEERKRKRQLSVEKKKKKKKMKKEMIKVDQRNKEKDMVKNEKLKEIDVKYNYLFTKADKFVIFKVKGDGACGSNCVTIEYHHDEKLGKYVRRNINQIMCNFGHFTNNAFSFHTHSSWGGRKKHFKMKQNIFSFFRRTVNQVSFGWITEISKLCLIIIK